MTKELDELVGKDVFDSRDLAERLEEMEGERQALEDEIEEKQDELNDLDDDASTDDRTEAEDNFALARKELHDWDEAYGEELKTLQNLREEVGSEFDHGVTFIEEGYWTEYVQDLCEDIGDLPKDLPSYIVIDWDATAENIKVDYSETEIGGYTYIFRSA